MVTTSSVGVEFRRLATNRKNATKVSSIPDLIGHNAGLCHIYPKLQELFRVSLKALRLIPSRLFG